ncbi:helix-turn-helix DNA-binding domain protein [Mycobacterium phage Acolyte]|nr:helix-turn-helix DNA-binding domain protein [Mycobacterium phage Acolyte]
MSWDPNHPSLKSPIAPHETAGVLRMHRAGYKGADIMKILKLRGTRLMSQMQRALDEETRAGHAGRPIHDGLIKR